MFIMIFKYDNREIFNFDLYVVLMFNLVLIFFDLFFNFFWKRKLLNVVIVSVLANNKMV